MVTAGKGTFIKGSCAGIYNALIRDQRVWRDRPRATKRTPFTDKKAMSPVSDFSATL